MYGILFVQLALLEKMAAMAYIAEVHIERTKIEALFFL
jgi:hypothetical protein